MYTILVNDDNSLVASIKERIMQRSKLVDSMHFLVNPQYKGKNMGEFTVRLEYRLPISMEPHSEILECTKDDGGDIILYKDMLEYKLAFDSCLTKEAGEVEMQLSFTNVELDENGNVYQLVRKTSPTTITIVPVSAWCIPSDTALDAIDQRQLKADAQIKALNDLNEVISQSKADNIVMDDKVEIDDEGNETVKKVVRLTANGEKIGNEIEISKIVTDAMDEVVNANGEDGLMKVVMI